MGANIGLGWDLNLLNYWQLKLDGEPVEVGERQQRLITALALLGARSRRFIANLLWPDHPEVQAASSLRASVFRVSHQLPSLLRSSLNPLALDNRVTIDIQRVRHLISEIDDADATLPADSTDVLRTANLLPGWYEDWVLFEQERLQQQRLGALEALARRYLALGDIGRMMDAASVAAVIEPLRESAQLLLVRGYLASDNHASATRLYQDFRVRVQRELGVAPSPRFVELLGIESPIATNWRTPM